jgi:hypothetical protein
MIELVPERWIQRLDRQELHAWRICTTTTDRALQIAGSGWVQWSISDHDGLRLEYVGFGNEHPVPSRFAAVSVSACTS